MPSIKSGESGKKWGSDDTGAVIVLVAIVFMLCYFVFAVVSTSFRTQMYKESVPKTEIAIIDPETGKQFWAGYHKRYVDKVCFILFEDGKEHCGKDNL